MKKGLIGILLLLNSGLLAQSTSSIGWLPKVAVSHRWAEKVWRITGQVESMQRMWNQPANEPVALDYRYIRTDVTLVLSYRLNPNWNLALGQMTRFSDGEVVFRSLQQASFTSRGGNLRLGHRFRTDQTFRPNERTEYRLRYRLTAEIPLKGQTLNDREWYFKPGFEQLLGLQAKEWSYEQRFLASFGYFFNSANKVEFGVDHRFDNFIEGAGRHRIWKTITYYLNF